MLSQDLHKSLHGSARTFPTPFTMVIHPSLARPLRWAPRRYMKHRLHLIWYVPFHPPFPTLKSPLLQSLTSLGSVITTDPRQTNIHYLAQRGDTQTLLTLLQSNPTLNLSSRDNQDVTPLHWASINAHMSTCRFLLDNGADVDAIGGELKATSLQWAARNGHLYVVQLLLSRGADPNLVDGQGFNTLHLVTHSSAVMPLLYMVSLV